MRPKSIGVAIGVVVVFAFVLSPPLSFAGLLGSNVTGWEYYPDTSSIYSGPIGPLPVTNAIEFPGTLAWDGNLDVADTQIIWTATATVQYGGGSFNGFRLAFAGTPTIIGLTVDGATTLPPESYWFTGNEVWINLAGLSAISGQQTILDVQTSAIPEPGSLVLLGTGLLGAAGYVRRKLAM